LTVVAIVGVTLPSSQGAVPPAIHWNHTRGLVDESFELVLETDLAGATIYYTMDCSIPSATHGLEYRAPVPIEQTTVLRAVVVDAQGESTQVETQTFLFVAQVADQEPFPEGYICQIISQRNGPNRPHTFDWGMDPEILEDVDSHGDLEEHLQSLPTLSVVMEVEDFNFIYANHQYRGVAYERPASVELIYPGHERFSGFAGFQIDCGIRMQGGGAVDQARKKSFRLLFKTEYGAGSLDYPLFECAPHFAGNAASRYEGVVLRAGGNTNWSKDDAWKHAPSTYLRDSLVRDSQVAMSGLGSRSVFVHLYVHRFYFGLYNIAERPDAKFLSSYLGGEVEHYYSMNHDGPVEGDPSRWNEIIHSSLLTGLEVPSRYQAVTEEIDVEAFCDYVLLNWLVGMGDWPWNNFYGGVRNTPAGRIRFLSWDAEYAFWTLPGYLNSNPTAWVNPNFQTDTSTLPRVWRALAQNEEFIMTFADRVYRQCFNFGPLTDARLMARFERLAEGIENAIVAESARWGDSAWGREDNPHTRVDDWIPNRVAVLELIDGNVATFLLALRAAKLYPSIDPPFLPGVQAPVTAAFAVTMENLNPAGTVYYTVDGTDPRLPGNAVSTTARPYREEDPPLVRRATRVKARVRFEEPPTAPVWSALNEQLYLAEPVGFPLRITELMYHPMGNEALEFLELKNVSSVGLDLTGCYFRGLDYRFSPGTYLRPYQVWVLIPNDDPPAFDSAYPGVEVFDTYRGHLSNGGEEIAVYDQYDRCLTSVFYDDDPAVGWPTAADGQDYSLEVVDTLIEAREASHWRLSPRSGGSPGQVRLAEADTDRDGFGDEAEFHAGTDPDDPNSSLQLNVERLDGGQVRIRFQQVAGYDYFLESCTQLDSSDAWDSVRNFPAVTGKGIRTTDEVILELRRACYYRLLVSRP
jgi:hypothetical protein